MSYCLRTLRIAALVGVGLALLASNAHGAQLFGSGHSDVLVGGNGDDVMIGMLGSDVLLGDSGNDIMIGGIERGTQPNSDIQRGVTGNDVALWAGGDGSDLFDGGSGRADALVFGTIDRDQTTNVPILSPVTGRHHRTGLPTANVTGQAGFCTLDRVAEPDTRGFEFLVRFFSKANGNLLVTVRTHDVEQVFCTAQDAAAVTFADLTERDPAFVEISLDDLPKLNRDVALVIR